MGLFSIDDKKSKDKGKAVKKGKSKERIAAEESAKAFGFFTAMMDEIDEEEEEGEDID